MKTLNELEFNVLKIKGRINTETKLSVINTLKDDLKHAELLVTNAKHKLLTDPIGTRKEMRRTLVSKMNGYALANMDIPASIKEELKNIDKQLYDLEV